MFNKYYTKGTSVMTARQQIAPILHRINLYTVLTIILPSNRRSVCSYSQICTFCRLCKNRNMRFCKKHTTFRRLDIKSELRGIFKIHEYAASMQEMRTTHDGLGHDPLHFRRHDGCFENNPRGLLTSRCSTRRSEADAQSLDNQCLYSETFELGLPACSG